MTPRAFISREPPELGLAPSVLWTVPLPPPHRIGGPFLPTLPLPLPGPTTRPAGSLCDAPGEGSLGWRGGGGAVEGEVPSSGTWGQTHVWGYSNQIIFCTSADSLFPSKTYIKQTWEERMCQGSRRQGNISLGTYPTLFQHQPKGINYTQG